MIYPLVKDPGSGVREHEPPYRSHPGTEKGGPETGKTRPETGKTRPETGKTECHANRKFAERILQGFQDLARSEATITIREARLWQGIQESRAYRDHGHQNLGDFSREVLGSSPATAHRRVRLARVFDRSPLAEKHVREGRVGVCQVILLNPVLGTGADVFWLRLAGRLTFRELRALVIQAKQHDATVDPEEGITPKRMRVNAPMSVALSWEQALELGRRTLGYEAPLHTCFAAMLAEAEAGFQNEVRPMSTHRAGEHSHDSGNQQGKGEDRDPHGTCKPHGKTDAPHPTVAPLEGSPGSWHPHPTAATRTLETLALIHRELLDLEALCQNPCAADAVAQLKTLQQLSRPLRLLRARLLRDARAVDLPSALGYPDLNTLLRHGLRVSERSARDLLAEGTTFRAHGELEQAFVEGRISGAQARTIRRLAAGGDLGPWIQRAESVTRLYFDREARWILRCRDLLPHLGTHRPLPQLSPEPLLVTVLEGHGWTRSALEAHLNATAADPPQGPDPATDPRALRRLEILLDLCLLAEYPDGVTGEFDFSGADILPGSGEPSINAPGIAPPENHRQTLITDTTLVPIYLALPPSVHDQWLRLAARVRERHGPAPTWAVFGYVVCAAIQQWDATDPATRPTEYRILHRDAYRCTAPGCSSRRNLEVHHILFRSRQGSDHAWNLTTLCSLCRYRHNEHYADFRIMPRRDEVLSAGAGLGLSNAT